MLFLFFEIIFIQSSTTFYVKVEEDTKTQGNLIANIYSDEGLTNLVDISSKIEDWNFEWYGAGDNNNEQLTTDKLSYTTQSITPSTVDLKKYISAKVIYVATNGDYPQDTAVKSSNVIPPVAVFYVKVEEDTKTQGNLIANIYSDEGLTNLVDISSKIEDWNFEWYGADNNNNEQLTADKLSYTTQSITPSTVDLKKYISAKVIYVATNGDYPKDTAVKSSNVISPTKQQITIFISGVPQISYKLTATISPSLISSVTYKWFIYDSIDSTETDNIPNENTNSLPIIEDYLNKYISCKAIVDESDPNYLSSVESNKIGPISAYQCTIIGCDTCDLPSESNPEKCTKCLGELTVTEEGSSCQLLRPSLDPGEDLNYESEENGVFIYNSATITNDPNKNQRHEIKLPDPLPSSIESRNEAGYNVVLPIVSQEQIQNPFEINANNQKFEIECNNGADLTLEKATGLDISGGSTITLNPKGAADTTTPLVLNSLIPKASITLKSRNPLQFELLDLYNEASVEPDSQSNTPQPSFKHVLIQQGYKLTPKNIKMKSIQIGHDSQIDLSDPTNDLTSSDIKLLIDQNHLSSKPPIIFDSSNYDTSEKLQNLPAILLEQSDFGSKLKLQDENEADKSVKIIIADIKNSASTSSKILENDVTNTVKSLCDTLTSSKVTTIEGFEQPECEYDNDEDPKSAQLISYKISKSPIPTPEESPSDDEPNEKTTTTKKKGLSGGAIAGIVIACVVVVAAIIALLVYFLVIKKKNETTTSTQGDSSIAI